MANFNLNKVMLGGRLTADPELRTTPGGASVTSFTIAVNRTYAKETDEVKADFFNCTAWHKTAEFITKFFRKASCIYVEGYQKNQNWVDEKGIKRFGTTVIVEQAHFVDGKSDSGSTGNKQPMGEPPAGYYGKAGDGYGSGFGQPTDGNGQQAGYTGYAPGFDSSNFEDLEGSSDELPF